jgi:ABC-type glycerol-3-phosphate transport system substrate-binding protein
MSQPIANGLVYDLSTLDFLDFTESKWNQSAINKVTFGNAIYGMAVGKPEPRDGVFWNKRLFEEAGLNRDLPYDLQSSGEWTWDKFEEICKTLTRDTNNDGTIDTYAMVSFSVDFFAGIQTSADAHYIKKGTDDKFYNATTEPQFLEAMQYAVGLIQKGYEMPAPPNSNWDWFVSAFHDAKVAMQFA